MIDCKPYDELPYRCVPIEWTAPDRLAVTSLLHGGPRPSVHGCRVLECGCGTAANLLPMAYFRRHSAFVGVDGGRKHIAEAESRRVALALDNVSFLHSDIAGADELLDSEFDFIIAHGLFSWIAPAERESFFTYAGGGSHPTGLLYLNYNAQPGWGLRGAVRRLLLEYVGAERPLEQRAASAQRFAERLHQRVKGAEHPYTLVIAQELAFVGTNERTYVAHEYLAAHNQAYWRSEFLQMMRTHGFDYVADADFNYATGRVPDDVLQWASEEGAGTPLDDLVDFLCNRQLHSPILSRRPLTVSPPTPVELSDLIVALLPCSLP